MISNPLRLSTVFTALSLLVLGACDESSGPSTDSQTHWLKQCVTTTDCGEGLECLCGMCTFECDGPDECSELAAAAICVNAAYISDVCESAPESSDGICGLACQGDGDCHSAAPGTVCSDGTCLPPGARGPELDMGSDVASSGCPVARPRARLLGGDAVWETEIDVTAVTSVELDGSLSTARDGIASYSWEITEKPDGSATVITPEPSLERVEAQLDLTGRYVFSLTVTDTNDTPNCELASAVVNAGPGQGIHVELFWPTDGEASAQPMEIHFLNTLGEWTDEVFDCTVGNTDPEWGDGQSTTDNPSLLLSNEDDLVPSVVTLPEPEDVQYLVGVLCPSATEAPGCRATLKVFLDGSEFTLSSPELFEPGNFWDAVDVYWEQRETSETDRIYENGIPGSE